MASRYLRMSGSRRLTYLEAKAARVGLRYYAEHMKRGRWKNRMEAALRKIDEAMESYERRWPEEAKP